MESRKFSAVLGKLHDMLGWIRSESEKFGFDSANLYKIELASEEALVNIIHHSYRDKGGEIEITICKIFDELQISIIDNGIPFNLLNQKDVDITSNLEEREMGGLGIHFIRKCLDDVRYQRKKNQNILTLIKRVH